MIQSEAAWQKFGLVFLSGKGRTFGAPGWMVEPLSDVRGNVRTCPKFGVSALGNCIGVSLLFKNLGKLFKTPD